ncbi:MAG: OB-fold nucleic acid binding domain-containing protein [Clostridia bacterium]|nr:OB-fold nucleic acid binding domain-containing protein [Clostridia bacterium]
MKKLIAFCLAMLLCLSVFAACDTGKGNEETTAGKEETTAGKEETTAGKEETTTGKEETTTEGTEETTTEETTTPGSAYDVEAAAAFLDAQYKNADTITPVDYEVFGQVMVGLDKYMVSWTTDSDKVTAVEGSPKWTIQVDELSLETVNYKIIGTITAPDGTTATVSYDRVVPKFEVTSFEDYMAAEEGTSVTVAGIVVGINAKSAGNTRNHLFLADVDGKGGYYCYQLEQDPLEEGVALGMTVAVTAPVTPYNGMQETKGGGFVIIDETIKEVSVHDITDKFAAGEDLWNYVGLVVTIKGVTIGAQELEKDTSQYLWFAIGEKTGYVRTYVTDFPTTLKAEDKSTIDEAHAANFGNTADATGILIFYGTQPYLIPVSTDCFSNYQVVTKTDAEKVEAEKEAVSVNDRITEDTTITLPSVGQYYDDVTITWTVDNEAYTITDGKLVIALGEEQATLKLTATITCGEVAETKEFELKIDAAATDIYVAKPVTTPEADTAYKFFLVQGNLGQTLYLTGEVSGRYLVTTDKAAQAVDVYAEAVEGGFKFYILVDDAKQYITVYNNADNKLSVKFDAEGTSVYAYNATVNAWVTNMDGTDYYLGTYNTYNTVSASKLSYITAENTGVSQFPAGVGSFELATEKEEHVCEFADATCTSPKTCACGKTEGEALGHNIVENVCQNCGAKVVTVTEAAALEDGTLVLINATVSKITYNWSDSSKNMSVDITDGTTTLNAYKLGSKVGAGDVIIVYGKVGSYKDNKQIVDATAEVVTAHTCTEFTDATCDAPKTCTVCGATEGEALGHNYVDGICDRDGCGAEKPASTTYTFADYEAGEQYAAGEVHKLDDNVTVTTTDCHFTTQLRLYYSEVNDWNPNGRNGVAVFAMTSAVKSLSLNAGEKAGPMAVYGSTDGETWTLITTIDVTSTYTDYNVELGETAYTFIKLAATEKQVRVASITIELA